MQMQPWEKNAVKLYCVKVRARISFVAGLEINQK
jgi:hypothetical protein